MPLLLLQVLMVLLLLMVACCCCCAVVSVALLSDADARAGADVAAVSTTLPVICYSISSYTTLARTYENMLQFTMIY